MRHVRIAGRPATAPVSHHFHPRRVSTALPGTVRRSTKVLCPDCYRKDFARFTPRNPCLYDKRLGKCRVRRQAFRLHTRMNTGNEGGSHAAVSTLRQPLRLREGFRARLEAAVSLMPQGPHAASSPATFAIPFQVPPDTLHPRRPARFPGIRPSRLHRRFQAKLAEFTRNGGTDSRF